MEDEHQEQVNIAKPHIKIMLENIQPIQSAPYRAEPKAQDFRKAVINKNLLQKVVESVQTEWAAPTIFAPKKD